ncbi:MAG TPA: nitronate monooxygenase [Candidatus Competibacteraceae bacterium]|nr:nitronate monooxygenase [Candidatus Competibacteraceae bacterium]
MNWPQTSLTQCLGLRYPIIQAPMAGGPSTPALVAAVCNAGGLGSLAAGYLEPEQIRQAIREIRALTDQPFAVNLFVTETPSVDEARVARAQEVLVPIRQRLGLQPPAPTALPARYLPSFTEQLAVILEEAVDAFSFTFGIPKPEELEALKHAGILTIGTATHLLEAIVLEESGVDVVVAQGLEAGGHRATFLGNPEQGLVGTMPLVALLTDHLRIPVVAAGGIMDGRGIAAALVLGAAGAQMGTAFLATPESGAHPRYKELLLGGTEITTVLTRAFTGRLARALRNTYTNELAPVERELPEFPVLQALTRDIREAAARLERTEFMPLWAGQGCPLCRNRPAAELIATWVRQVEALFDRRGLLSDR